MSSIVIIAPFESLAGTAEEACTMLGEQISIVNANMDNAIALAKQAEEAGAEVIISRGTVAWRISDSDIQLPIVQIPITGYDLLRAFLEARQLGERIGIADTPDVLRGVESLESIFQWKIEKYPIYSLEEMEESVTALVNKGIDVLVGKFIYVQMLQNSSIKTVVLSSGAESVIQSITEAKNLVQVRRTEAAQAKRLRAILDFIRDGVIAVDAEGIVTVCNPAVEKIFQFPSEHLVGKKVDDVLTHSRIMHVLQSGKEELNRIQEENGVKIITNRVPILQGEEVIGVVSTFQEVSILQKQEQEIRKKLSYRGHVAKYQPQDVIGQSPVFQQALGKVKKYAAVDSTVLLSGETGVGKEVFAHLIHQLSSRTDGPFVAVNCAAIPDNLLESELFGYVEGAFTGAKKGGKTGLFELAHGGTIFLDEIGELTESLQVRLLRVLQEGEVMRLGDERVIPINVRVVTASNRDLEEMVSEGSFRADLFYRINILHIHVPSLRERVEDIPLLCQHFFVELKKQIPKDVDGFHPTAMRMMKEYNWPGNIRQLRNFVERSLILTTDQWITYETILEAGGKGFQSIGRKFRSQFQSGEDEIVVEDQAKLRDSEREHILRVLEQVDGNRTEAAKILGIGRSTLWRKLRDN